MHKALGLIPNVAKPKNPEKDKKENLVRLWRKGNSYIEVVN
jgi:hypothetical protein